MLKTPDCGQFSYFTAHPGITRGGHYHHTKTEKFLVIKGQARFKFRHMQTGEAYELVTNGDKAEIVETVPGWTHDITNIGSDEMVVRRAAITTRQSRLGQWDGCVLTKRPDPPVSGWLPLSWFGSASPVPCCAEVIPRARPPPR